MKFSLKGIFKNKDNAPSNEEKDNVQQVSMYQIEHAYEKGEFLDAAEMLHILLEYYGEHKKKNHRYKGREFIHFILKTKHKDLKTIGYNHWVNLNKITHSSKKVIYPYHKQNLLNAIEFFKKEIKSLNNIKTYIKK